MSCGNIDKSCGYISEVKKQSKLHLSLEIVDFSDFASKLLCIGSPLSIARKVRILEEMTFNGNTYVVKLVFYSSANQE